MFWVGSYYKYHRCPKKKKEFDVEVHHVLLAWCGYCHAC